MPLGANSQGKDANIATTAPRPTGGVAFLGSMLFTRCVSGTRVVPRGQQKNVAGVSFTGYGASTSAYPHDYLTAACAVGLSTAELDEFLLRLDKTIRKAKGVGGVGASEGAGRGVEASVRAGAGATGIAEATGILLPRTETTGGTPMTQDAGNANGVTGKNMAGNGTTPTPAAVDCSDSITAAGVGVSAGATTGARAGGVVVSPPEGEFLTGNHSNMRGSAAERGRAAVEAASADNGNGNMSSIGGNLYTCGTSGNVTLGNVIGHDENKSEEGIDPGYWDDVD